MSKAKILQFKPHKDEFDAQAEMDRLAEEIVKILHECPELREDKKIIAQLNHIVYLHEHQGEANSNEAA